uniref:Major sperm protein n=1 Tax=Setaria digitata TaxID=48799 RepID=A0A915PTN7_9BILA
MRDRSDDNCNSIDSKVLGDTPEFELQLIPSWIVFTATDNYKTAQYTRFKVRNNDSTPVVYRLRTKERSFPRFSACHGYLEPDEEDEIHILIPASDHWPRDPAEFAGHQHKVMIENLTVPKSEWKPKDKNEASAISGEKVIRIFLKLFLLIASLVMIFKSTPPLTRMYTKLNILLPKIKEETTPESATDISS